MHLIKIAYQDWYNLCKKRVLLDELVVYFVVVRTVLKRMSFITPFSISCIPVSFIEYFVKFTVVSIFLLIGYKNSIEMLFSIWKVTIIAIKLVLYYNIIKRIICTRSLRGRYLVEYWLSLIFHLYEFDISSICWRNLICCLDYNLELLHIPAIDFF